MRTSSLLLVTLATAMLAPAVALADNADVVAGTFDVKYEEVTSNCTNTGMVMTRGTVAIAKRKASTVAVDIERIPVMTGSAVKGGRVKATSKLGKTSIQGLDGRFSVAGTVNGDGVMNVVFVAEYYVDGKAYCTQSWNVSGFRKEAPATPKSAPAELSDGLSGVPDGLPVAPAMAPAGSAAAMTAWMAGAQTIAAE